jgi:hypothetical protein
MLSARFEVSYLSALRGPRNIAVTDAGVNFLVLKLK